MTVDWFSHLNENLLGRLCEIVRREADWAVYLTGGGCISLPVPWRIVANGRIAFADEDDGQKFGHAVPVNGVVKVNDLMRGHPISGVRVAQDSADLTLHFGDTLRLDASTIPAVTKVGKLICH